MLQKNKILISLLSLTLIFGNFFNIYTLAADNFQEKTMAIEMKSSNYGINWQAVEVVNFVNRVRIREGLQPLAMHTDLTIGAQIRAEELVYLQTHDRPDGRSWETVLPEAGVAGAWEWGENIAWGQSTPQGVMFGPYVWNWMNSPGHRENILRSNFNYIGVGYNLDTASRYRYHWAQLFMAGPQINGITVQAGERALDVGGRVEDTGARILLNTADGSYAFIPILTEMVSGLDNNIAGVQVATVHYREFTASFEVNVGSHEAIAVPETTFPPETVAPRVPMDPPPEPDVLLEPVESLEPVAPPEPEAPPEPLEPLEPSPSTAPATTVPPATMASSESMASPATEATTTPSATTAPSATIAPPATTTAQPGGTTTPLEPTEFPEATALLEPTEPLETTAPSEPTEVTEPAEVTEPTEATELVEETIPTEQHPDLATTIYTLNMSIVEATKLEVHRFTPESWAILEVFFAEAVKALDSEDIDLIQEVTLSLWEAIASLEPSAPPTLPTDSDEYIAPSDTAFQAEETACDETVSLDLGIAVAIDELEAVIIEATSFRTEEFTPESLVMLEFALVEAMKALDGNNIDYISEVTILLQEAINSLELYYQSTQSTMIPTSAPLETTAPSTTSTSSMISTSSSAESVTVQTTATSSLPTLPQTGVTPSSWLLSGLIISGSGLVITLKVKNEK